MSDPRSVREARREAAARLQAAGVASPGHDADALLAHVLGVDRGRLALLEDLSPAAAEEYAALLARREAREPLQHLVGVAWFRHVELAVGPGVFVPRPETELLAGWAIEAARSAEHENRTCRVVDLCTGSGAVALALSVERPDLELYAADLHPAALRCARANLLDRAQVCVSDLFAGLPSDLRGRVDVATANVPYVPTGELGLLPPEARDHEPPSTHDGGEDGLDVVRRVAKQARDWLVPGGHVVVELNRRQVANARFAVATAGLRPSVVAEDEDGTVFLAGRLG